MTILTQPLSSAIKTLTAFKEQGILNQEIEETRTALTEHALQQGLTTAFTEGDVVISSLAETKLGQKFQRLQQETETNQQIKARAGKLIRFGALTALSAAGTGLALHTAHKRGWLTKGLARLNKTIFIRRYGKVTGVIIDLMNTGQPAIVSLVNDQEQKLVNMWEGTLSFSRRYPETFVLTTEANEKIIVSLSAVDGYVCQTDRDGRIREVNIIVQDDGAVQVNLDLDEESDWSTNDE